MLIVGGRGLRRVIFDGPEGAALSGPWADAFISYLRGQPFPPALPVDLDGLPPFTRRVLEACRTIPFGETRSYRELAAMAGNPRAAQAVGQALARNPTPVVIPCHRVIGADGQLAGFTGGLTWKRALLAHEGIEIG